MVKIHARFCLHAGLVMETNILYNRADFKRFDRGDCSGVLVIYSSGIQEGAHMEWGTVSMASMLGMIFSLVVSIGVPVVLLIVIYKKTRAKISSFFIGCGIFVGFALILEQILHTVVLTVAGTVIQSNVYLYGLYGGFAAALFEETGRFIAMKYCMKKNLDRGNALMYGAGHGGAEAILIMGLTGISNLITSIMINSGTMQLNMAALPNELQETTFQQLTALWQLPAWQFYMGGVERLSAIVLQIGFSVLMYTAVKTGQKKYLIGAYLAHFAVDFLTVVFASIIPIWALELALIVIAAALGFYAAKLYRDDQKLQPADAAEQS